MAELFKYNDSYILKDYRHEAEEALKEGIEMLEIYLKNLDKVELDALYNKLCVGDQLEDKKYIKECIENIYTQKESENIRK